MNALVDSGHAHLHGFSRLEFGDTNVTALPDDFGNAQLPCLEPKSRHIEQRLEIDRRLAVTIRKFITQLVKIGFRTSTRQLAVGFQSQFVGIDVADGNGRFDRQIDCDSNRFRTFRFLVLLDGLGHHAHIQIETNTLDMPALLVAQQIAGATQLKILHRHVKT